MLHIFAEEEMEMHAIKSGQFSLLDSGSERSRGSFRTFAVACFLGVAAFEIADEMASYEFC